MNLFQLGSIELSHGVISQFKIECDALTNDDIECVAYLLEQCLPAFGNVIGVPRGGLRLASAMEKFVTDGPLLIVDDVLTTGSSMWRYRDKYYGESTIGGVIFSRGDCPDWITPLFQIGEKYGYSNY